MSETTQPLPQAGDVWRHNETGEVREIKEVFDWNGIKYVGLRHGGPVSVEDWNLWLSNAARLHPNQLAEENAKLREKVAELERESHRLRQTNFGNPVPVVKQADNTRLEGMPEFGKWYVSGSTSGAIYLRPDGSFRIAAHWYDTKEEAEAAINKWHELQSQAKGGVL